MKVSAMGYGKQGQGQIALSALYGLIVVAYAWHTLPTIKDVEHEGVYVSRMSREAQEILRVEPKRRPFKPSRDDLGKNSLLYRFERELHEIDDRDIVRVVMANGHNLEIASQVSERQRKLVEREYAAVLQSALPEKQLKAIMWAFQYWLLPVLSLCALGLVARWIYTGFKQRGSA